MSRHGQQPWMGLKLVLQQWRALPLVPLTRPQHAAGAFPKLSRPLLSTSSCRSCKLGKWVPADRGMGGCCTQGGTAPKGEVSLGSVDSWMICSQWASSTKRNSRGRALVAELAVLQAPHDRRLPHYCLPPVVIRSIMMCTADPDNQTKNWEVSHHGDELGSNSLHAS